jgi:hypothetical protein
MGKRAAFTNTIWRTVVFAGAMLATPVVAGCGGSSKPATTPPTSETKTAKPSDDPDAHGITAEDAAAQAKFEEQEAKKAEDAKAAADAKAAEDQAIADKLAADQAAAEEAAKPRPRANTKSRKTGRGFVLS